MIYQLPSMDSKKFKIYEFPQIEETFFLEKSITKYEIPQYIQDIPEGFSIFCTLWEASKVKQYILLSQEEQDKLNLKDNYDKLEKDNNLNEPIPKSNFCYICHKKFDNYLFHIETQSHKDNLNQQNLYYKQRIKNTFKRINKFLNNNISDDLSDESNSESSNESSIDKISIFEENKKMKAAILTSNFIKAINDDIKIDENENDLDNKENIDENKKDTLFEKFRYNYGNNFNIKDNKYIKKNNISNFKVLKKKRITFDVIRYESPTNKTFEVKRRDYFNYLNKYKTKKFIRNNSVFFE